MSLVFGFAAMVPFMNTAVIVGPAASALDRADLSFFVGFMVAAVIYLAVRNKEASNPVLVVDVVCGSPSRKTG